MIYLVPGTLVFCWRIELEYVSDHTLPSLPPSFALWVLFCVFCRRTCSLVVVADALVYYTELLFILSLLV